METEIKVTKNEDGSFTIINENIENVRLENLEQQLLNLEILEQQAIEFNAWVDTLPQEKQDFIQKQYYIIPQELRDKINLLKSCENANNI